MIAIGKAQRRRISGAARSLRAAKRPLPSATGCAQISAMDRP
jgi:hypothetical protein